MFDWPGYDPCIHTSILLAGISAFLVVSQKNITRVTIMALVAGIASIMYRQNRQLTGHPNTALFLLDFMCAVMLFLLCANDVPCYFYLPVVVLFVFSWVAHFHSKQELSRDICVSAHCVAVLSFLAYACSR